MKAQGGILGQWLIAIRDIAQSYTCWMRLDPLTHVRNDQKFNFSYHMLYVMGEICISMLGNPFVMVRNGAHPSCLAEHLCGTENTENKYA